MGATLALLLALNFGAGPDDELVLGNARSTYGPAGPQRPEAKVLPGDTLFLSFAINGVKADSHGKAHYAVGLAVSDGKGKLQFRQAAREFEGERPGNGTAIPARAEVQVGLDQPAGDYAATFSVFDRTSGTSKELRFPYQVLPRSFGFVRLNLTTDLLGRKPTEHFKKGQPVWVHFSLVGFERDASKKQPDVQLSLAVADDKGNPALKEPPTGTVNQDVSSRVQVLPLLFEVRLHETGTFTATLKAEDRVAGHTATLSFPIRIADATETAVNQPVVAMSVSEAGTVLRQKSGAKAWDVAAPKGALHAGDLLVGLPGAKVASLNEAVQLTMHSVLDGLSPFSVIESAVRLRENPRVDLDFDLDRGRVELSNHKDAGPARVRFHVQQESWEVILAEPGTRVALELSGRHPRGTVFTRTPGPKDGPTALLFLLVLQGEATVNHNGFEVGMRAPPGPALLEWDSVTGQDNSPQHLEKAPPWAAEDGPDAPAARARQACIQRLREALATKSVDATLDQFVHSEDAEDRRTGVFLMTALDELPLLGQVLREMKYPDLADTGILALRHWIGRGPGRDLALFRLLREHAKFSPAHAATAVNFLHSPGEVDLSNPAYYQALIHYLDHDRPLVRGLAYWHLYRLVPAGREFGYRALDSKEARAAAIEKWQKLIPPGKVPGHAAANNPKK